MEAAARKMLNRADDMDVYELPSDIEVRCVLGDDLLCKDEEIDSDDEQVVGRAEAKRIRKAKRKAAKEEVMVVTRALK